MKQQGFTLIELMTACSIISFVMLAGSTSYGVLIKNSQINSDKSRLLFMVRMARQQSIVAASTVVLCPSSDTETCIRDWTLPIILFNDTNKNKKRDNGEVITKTFPAFNQKGVLVNYPKSQIRFNSQGMANYYNGTLSYCNGNTIEAIIISRIGRIRFAQDLNGDDIPDVNLSTSVSCQ